MTPPTSPTGTPTITVCRHVLQCGQQGKEQFVPKYPGWQAVKNKTKALETI